MQLPARLREQARRASGRDADGTDGWRPRQPRPRTVAHVARTSACATRHRRPHRLVRSGRRAPLAGRRQRRDTRLPPCRRGRATAFRASGRLAGERTCEAGWAATASACAERWRPGGRAMTGERLSYRFGPLERRGLLGPLRFGQVVTIGSALAIGVELLDRIGGGAGVMAAIALLAGAVGTGNGSGGRTHDRGVGARRLRLRRSRGPRASALSLPAPGGRHTVGWPHADARAAGHSARRRARHRRAQRSRARRAVGASRPAADAGARLPGALLRAARSGGPGAPARSLGNRSGDSGERPREATAMDRADHAGTG